MTANAKAVSSKLEQSILREGRHDWCPTKSSKWVFYKARWPSGLRRQTKETRTRCVRIPSCPTFQGLVGYLVRKGVGSNPTLVTTCCDALRSREKASNTSIIMFKSV